MSLGLLCYFHVVLEWGKHKIVQKGGYKTLKLISLGYLNTKDGIVGSGVRLREYTFRFPLEAKHCHKLKPTTKQINSELCLMEILKYILATLRHHRPYSL